MHEIARDIHKEGPSSAPETLSFEDGKNVQVPAQQQIEELTVQLREQKQLLSMALETARLGQWQLDLATGALECTETCKAQFGLPAEAVFTYDALVRRIHPDDRASMQRAVESAIAERRAYLTEYRVIWPDTSLHWIRARGEARYANNGTPVMLIGLTLDISEQKRLEETVEQKEQVLTARVKQLEAIFESVIDGIALYDADGHILHMNKAAHEQSAHYAFTADPTASVAERLKQLEPRDAQGNFLTAEMWPTSRLLSGETLRGKNAPDIVLRTLDGQTRWFNTSGAPIHDAMGQIIGAVAVTRDVTERRQIERRTHNALEALLVLAEGLVQPISQNATREDASEEPPKDRVAQYLVELICRVLDCERASLTLFNPETGTLHSFAVAGLPPELEKRWRARQAGFHLSEQLHNMNTDAQLRAGEVLLFDFTQPPLQGRPNPYGIQKMLLAPMRVDTSLVGVLALDHGGDQHEYTPNELALTKAVADLAALVVERERLIVERAEGQANELALRESNRLMDEFIGIASHEIRTPLTTIKASVQLARRQLNRAQGHDEAAIRVVIANVQGFLERAERQIGMQNRLVSDLLDVSRIRANRLELQPDLCNVVAIVRETVEDQHYLTPTRSISLNISTHDEVLVMADAGRVGQVVNNYLSNALKYSEAHKPVIVSIEQQGSIVRISVRDEGPGLALIEQQRVWERFYRVESIAVKSGSGVGLGLGLHISKTIIERQGGQVGVESTPGKGATFWFTLPLAELYPKAREE